MNILPAHSVVSALCPPLCCILVKLRWFRFSKLSTGLWWPTQCRPVQCAVSLVVCWHGTSGCWDTEVSILLLEIASADAAPVHLLRNLDVLSLVGRRRLFKNVHCQHDGALLLSYWFLIRAGLSTFSVSTDLQSECEVGLWHCKKCLVSLTWAGHWAAVGTDTGTTIKCECD